MKTIDPPLIQPDPVIAAVRRAKTELAARHNFDVSAMVRALQKRENPQKHDHALGANPPMRASHN
jgi:hypothetical protein